MDVKNLLYKEKAPYLANLKGILILFIIALLIPLVVKSPYYLTLLITAGTGAILAMTFILLLRTGLVSMAIAAFWGTGAYFSTMMSMKLSMSFWLCLPLSAISTGIIALILGLILIRNPGFSFVIMTMVIAMVFVVAVGSTEELGGYSGILRIPRPDPIHIPFLFSLKFKSNMASYYLMVFLSLLMVIILSALYASSIGRAWTMIGLNSQLAESLGIDVFRYRMAAFFLSGFISGLMGSFYAHYLGSVNPETFNLFKTVHIFIYAILGGIQFPFLGPIIGSLVMVFLPEFMRVTQELESIITGGFLLILIIFLPTGILSLPGLRTLAANPTKLFVKFSSFFQSLGSSERSSNRQ